MRNRILTTTGFPGGPDMRSERPKYVKGSRNAYKHDEVGFNSEGWVWVVTDDGV